MQNSFFIGWHYHASASLNVCLSGKSPECILMSLSIYLQLIQAIFFSYSLDNRIIPRHKVLVENRINFKLRYMLAGPDDEFYKRVEAAIERRRRFESGIMDINPQTQTANSSSEQIQVNSSEMRNPQDSLLLPSWSSMYKRASFFFSVY